MFRLTLIEMLYALSASYVFPLQLRVYLPRTDNWLFSLTNATYLGLRPPVAVTDG